MGAAASATYQFSSEDKKELTKALEETYHNVTQHESKGDAELFDALKSTFEAKTKALEASKPEHNDFSSIQEGSAAPEVEVPEAAAAVVHLPPPSESPAGRSQSDKSPKRSRITAIGKGSSFGTNVEEEGEDDLYEYNIRNSVQMKAGAYGSLPTMMTAGGISKIEGPGKLLKAKTSSQLLSMVDDSVLDDQTKIALFIEQLKSGAVQTKTKTEFRQRRLTYSQQTVNESPEVVDMKHISPVKPMNKKNRTTIFASSEIGVKQEKQPPFPNDILGTYSCHGIEPSPDEEDGIHEKINQDRGCVVYPYHNKRNEALFMVLDGHGEQGDKVSEFVMRQIVVSLEKDPLLNIDPVAALKNAYITTNTALLVTDIHYMTSGCTCVTIYIKDKTMYVANAGDSRAVMARSEGGQIVAKDLSTDHKPDDAAEKARIESWGGFVCPPHEEGLSARVYLDADFTMIGLAMSRSIGDHAVKNVGVIAEPEVKVYTVDEGDQYLIMASDGVWEFISSQEAVDIVQSTIQDGVHDAVQELIETAACRWQEEEGDYRDDITAVVVRFPLPGFVDE